MSHGRGLRGAPRGEQTVVVPASACAPPPYARAAVQPGQRKAGASGRRPPTRVWDVVDLALKGADGGSVPAHVGDDALHNLPARGAEQHLVSHLHQGRQHISFSHMTVQPAEGTAGSRHQGSGHACITCTRASSRRSVGAQRCVAGSAPTSKGLEDRMMRPANRFSRISRPARPTARPPTPPMASTARQQEAGGRVRRAAAPRASRQAQVDLAGGGAAARHGKPAVGTPS